MFEAGDELRCRRFEKKSAGSLVDDSMKTIPNRTILRLNSPGGG